MIDQSFFLKILSEKGITFYTGVPDSYLNGFCTQIANLPQEKHVIAANEGNAIAIAAGHYFATGEIPLVYMQNSGMGNAMNPLLSLTDKNVYSVPMLLLIGWRGEPGAKDHPQHSRQGEIVTGLLDLWNIPYVVAAEEEIENQIDWAVREAEKRKSPVAIIARKGVFGKTEKENITDAGYELGREEAIEETLNLMPSDTIYVATTGRATRELFYLREKRGEKHDNDILNVGAMGHASSIALGLALAERRHSVVCLDGDAADIMHMGAMAVNANSGSANLLHIVLNNGAHESVGCQPSAGYSINLTQIAQGAGYRTFDRQVESRLELKAAVALFQEKKGPFFIDLRIHKGLKGTLPPLHISHGAMIQEFMNSRMQCLYEEDQ